MAQDHRHKAVGPKASDNNRGGMTLDEVGNALGVTRERARQIEQMALRKLRKRIRDYGLNIEDLRD